MGGGEIYRKIREIKEDTRVPISSGGSADMEVKEPLYDGEAFEKGQGGLRKKG